MYELTFTGKTPNILVNKVSVVNNSNADIIKMFVQATQQSISLSGYNCYIKFQSKSGLYFNKIKLDTTESEGMIEALWQLSFDYTQYKQLQCQLQFQSDSSDDVIWQSEIFYLNLSSTINVDKRIADTYPTILNQIEAEITTYAGRFDDIDAEIADLTEQVIAIAPITKYEDGGEPDLSVKGLVHFYRAFETAEYGLDAIEYVVIRQDSISYSTSATSTVNGQQCNIDNIASKFDDNYSYVIDYADEVTNVYTGYFTNLDSEIVLQAIRLGSAKNAGVLTLHCNVGFNKLAINIAAYFNYNKQSDEYTYDENVTIEINGIEYDLSDEEVHHIEVDIPSDRLITITTTNRRAYLYSLGMADVATQYESRTIANRETTVQYNGTENEPDRTLAIILTDDEGQRYTWSLSHYYDEENNIHYAYFDGALNVDTLLVDSAIYVAGELLQSGTKLYKHTLLVHAYDDTQTDEPRTFEIVTTSNSNYSDRYNTRNLKALLDESLSAIKEIQPADSSVIGQVISTYAGSNNYLAYCYAEFSNGFNLSYHEMFVDFNDDYMFTVEDTVEAL